MLAPPAYWANKIKNNVLISSSYLFLRNYSLLNMNKTNWKMEKNNILGMPMEEKRRLYKVKKYVVLDEIEPWNIYYAKEKGLEAKKPTLDDYKEFDKMQINREHNTRLAGKVSIFKGDITQLEVDAIVNAANSMLKAGGGVDGAIHRAAGPLLQAECNSLYGCPIGEAKITGGYNLPAAFVIHTVGPQDGCESALLSCYRRSLSYKINYNFSTMAFPCISTGIYGFPNRLAAHIALRAAREFLEENQDVDRIIFCTFLPIDVEIYETLMQLYFPVAESGCNVPDGAAAN